MQNEKNRTRAVTDVIIILVLTILTGTILIIACGANPADAYALFFRGIFGTKAGFTEIFVKACPLILTGLGCAVAYRTGFFNIGAEGQFYVGAMITTIIALNLTAGSWNPSVLILALAAWICWPVVLVVFNCQQFFKAKFNYAFKKISL